VLISILGWVGTTGTFGAYLLLSRGWLASHSLTYSMLNVVGGLLAAWASAAYGAWPSVVSNLVWAAVGLHAAGRTMVERRRADGPRRTQAPPRSSTSLARSSSETEALVPVA
jgi:hypothetical protein